MTGSPARPIFARSGRRSRRQDRLATTTIREFDGGWNVIDNDLNLSSKFAKTLDNMFRANDGSIQVRWGTRYFGRIDTQSASTGDLDDNPLTTTIGSAVVTVAHTGHGLISGHSITLAGLTAFDGIPAGELNATHTVTVVTANSYTITVTTTATAGGSGGGGTNGTFSHNNKQLTGDIINMVYFQDRLVIFDDNGEAVEMDSSGVTRVIWNSAIAAKLTGAPSGWSAMTFCSFAVFGGQLIVCNGIDKPILIDFTVTPPTSPVQYLQDLGTGSNANTPIARYVLAMDHYVLMAGDPNDVGLVHISNFDTSGTWAGDPNPNDGTTVSISKVTTTQNFTIRGLSRHRDRAVVALDDNLVLGQLGLYDPDTSAHIPDFSDVIEQHGSISHRSLQPLGNDLLMCDLVGVPSIARALFTGAIRPERASELIDPEIQSEVLALSVGSTEDRVFSVYNQTEGQYMLFVPNADTIGSTTETKCFVYTSVSSIKLKAWSRFRGWNFRAATKSALNRVFFANDTKVYIYGSRDDPIYSDFESDPIASIAGTSIKFTWEFPWADFDKRMSQKQSRYLALDTKGTGRFGIIMVADNTPRIVDATHPDPEPDWAEDFKVDTKATPNFGIAESTGGNVGWTSPSNITTEDGASASVTMTFSTDVSQFLRAQYSNITAETLGANSLLRIFGLQVSVKCHSGSSPNITAEVAMWDNSAKKIIGRPKTFIPPEVSTTMTFGGPGDMWGLDKATYYINGANNAIFDSMHVVIRVRPLPGATLPASAFVDVVKDATLFMHVADLDMFASGLGGDFVPLADTTIPDVGVYNDLSIASDERLWPWALKFKIGKFIIVGTTVDPLSFVSLSMAYSDGSIRR